MYSIGDLIDGKFRVTGICDSSGGMGEILFVTSEEPIKPPFPIVLKYCRSSSEEHVRRFKREVRLLSTFKGNSKVVEIWSFNVDHDPPYFVMKHYADGNARNLAARLANDRRFQEEIFLKMLDCVNELHIRGIFHRDLKPENFLIDGDSLRVADLGLSCEVGSPTLFTTTTTHLGTAGYIPPEFMTGEFRDAHPASDIFMLGRTFYVLVTGRPPAYLMREGVDPPLFYVLEKASNLVQAVRYQTLADFRQAIVNVYDVLLGRTGGELHQLASMINDRFVSHNQFVASEIVKFVEQLGMARESEQNELLPDLNGAFFSAISQPELAAALRSFLPIYQSFVDARSYSFSYAEVIARRMETVFVTSTVPDDLKATALRIAIRAAYHMNRFAAMDTCRKMVRSVGSESLALSVVPVITESESSFLADIEPSTCHSDIVKNAIRQVTRAEN